MLGARCCDDIPSFPYQCICIKAAEIFIIYLLCYITLLVYDGVLLFSFFFSCTLAMPKVVCCHDVVCQCRLTEVANSDSNKYFFHRKYLRRSIWWSPEANLSAFTPNQTTTHLLLLSFSQIRLKSSRPPPLFEQSLFHSFTCVLCTHETRWMYNKYIISATAICDILFPCFWSIHQVHDANA